MDSKAIGINIGVIDQQFDGMGMAFKSPAYLLLLDIDLCCIRNKNKCGMGFIYRIAFTFDVYG